MRSMARSSASSGSNFFCRSETQLDAGHQQTFQLGVLTARDAEAVAGLTSRSTAGAFGDVGGHSDDALPGVLDQSVPLLLRIPRS